MQFSGNQLPEGLDEILSIFSAGKFKSKLKKVLLFA